MDVVQAGAQMAGNSCPATSSRRRCRFGTRACAGPWALEVSGLVANPVRLTLEDLRDYPAAVSA